MHTGTIEQREQQLAKNMDIQKKRKRADYCWLKCHAFSRNIVKILDNK